MLCLLLAVVGPAVLSSNAAGAGFEEGLQAAQRGDYATALKEWRPLAEQRNAAAQNGLGLLYNQGLGVSQDYAEAATWLRRAAEQGDLPAQSQLGVLYATGHGVPQDLVLAHMWLSLAAPRLPAGLMRDRTVNARDAATSEMTPAQIAEAQRLAREWKPKPDRPSR